MNKKNYLILIIVIILAIVILFILNQYNLINYSPNEVNINNQTTTTTVNEVKVAFIGDQGLGDNAAAVLNLIKNENTDFVLHQGDLEYTDNPQAWNTQINEILGETFPYFSSIGNHDLKEWDGYQQKMVTRINKIPGITCQGDIGVKSSCEFMGIFFVLSGIGTLDNNHETFIQTELANSDATWKICSWHKNQTLMQLGGKGNEIGWEAYDICRQAGAIIATGHEHSYSRTHLMNNFANQKIANTSNTLNISPGKTFAFVSGIAGHGIRDTENNANQNPWWASTYTSDNNANYGSLFCTFNYEKNENKAHCYFKNIDGDIIDEFNLVKI